MPGAPVIKSYWTDLRHDARLIGEAAPGSSFIWAPRESGTFVVLLERADKPNIRAAETFSAMQGAEKGLQWYSIRIDGERGDICSFEPISAEDACTLAWGAKRRAEATEASGRVSELHM